ncbi:MAG: hypothetical protein ACXVAV_11890 [Ktedonobacteraceae bacterium]|jgi:hypothetical protein
MGCNRLSVHYWVILEMMTMGVIALTMPLLFSPFIKKRSTKVGPLSEGQDHIPNPVHGWG